MKPTLTPNCDCNAPMTYREKMKSIKFPDGSAFDVVVAVWYGCSKCDEPAMMDPEFFADDHECNCAECAWDE